MVSLLAFAGRPLEQALLVSPVLDMERLIRGMMAGACVSEEELRARGEIPVELGETLSWRYLQYARTHPLVVWDTPTAILYPEHDALTSRETVEAFVRRFRCRLTVLENAPALAPHARGALRPAPLGVIISACLICPLI